MKRVAPLGRNDQSKDMEAAAMRAAGLEGMALDSAYSGPALAALLAAISNGQLSGTVVFLHTGAPPAPAYTQSHPDLTSASSTPAVSKHTPAHDSSILHGRA